MLPIETLLLGPAAAASTRSSLPEMKSSRLGPAASLDVRAVCPLVGDDADAPAVLDDADEAAVAKQRLNACGSRVSWAV